MGRIGAIPKLPENVREALNAWLRDPGISQGEAADRTNTLLEGLGVEERVSRQAVNRYDLRMRKVGQKLREGRQVAEAWIAKLGSQPGGQMGHLVTELIRSLAFDLSLKVQELQEAEIDIESLPAAVGLVNKLALTAQRIERASDLSVNREQKIRRSERERAAEAVEKAVKAKGLSRESVDAIKREILGI